MKISCSAISLLTLCIVGVSTQALSQENNIPKEALKANYQVIYHNLPGSVDHFSAMFSEGEFYGRLRSNSFYFYWNTEDSAHSINMISGLGGSIIFKSGIYHDFDFSVGLYGSQAFFNEKEDPIAHLKPGKDLLSRYNYSNTGSKAMGVLGQAYLRYGGIEKTKLTLGRQLVETFYTKSNDSKMIPNTFDGAVAEIESISQTKIKLAYLSKQKLRDHTGSHSLLMYGDANSTAREKPQWSENDDAVMHRGLTYTALRAAGLATDAPLITGDIHNRSLPNLKADASFYAVPELLSQAMVELNYTFKPGENFTITPGVRYLRQFDNGAGAVGGASFFGKEFTEGYKDPDSLNAQMIAARLITKVDNYRFNLGFSYVFDEADLITPWRGFPTAGYTRSMGVYNWRANTKSYRFEMQKNANSQGVYKNLFIQASILYIDGDEDKIDPCIRDEIYYYVGFIQNIPSIPSLQWRLRLGYTQFLDSDANDFNCLDSRFELNYLF